MNQLDAIFDLMSKNKLSKRNLKESLNDDYVNKKPIAVYGDSAFSGFEILDVIYGIDDIAIVRDVSSGDIFECEIQYGTTGIEHGYDQGFTQDDQVFIEINGEKYPLDQFMRYESCGKKKSVKEGYKYSNGLEDITKDVAEQTKYKSVEDLYQEDRVNIIRSGNVFWIEKISSVDKIPDKVYKLLIKEVKRLYPELQYLYDISPVDEACGSDKKKKDDKKEEILNEKEDLKEGWYEDFSDYRKIPINDPMVMKCIESVLGQLSDGYWENSPRMESYWGMARTDDDNLYIYDKGDKFNKWKVNAGYKNPWTRNGFAAMTDSQVKQWFAKKIREIVKLEERDNQDSTVNFDFSFKPDNETPLDYFHDGVTVGDAYRAYQALIRG